MLARGVIFVDLALAQVAALGVTVAFLAGHPIQSDAAYWYALAFAVGGAALFSLTRVRHARIPQEAIIGIVYVVAAALTVLVVDRAPQGAEHIKQLLVGSLLTVTPGELVNLAVLYALIGVGHGLMRRPLVEISLRSRDRHGAGPGRTMVGLRLLRHLRGGGDELRAHRGRAPRLLLPHRARGGGRAAHRLGPPPSRHRLGPRRAVSATGLWASFAWDLPTGAAIVATFGVLMAAVAAVLGARAACPGRARRAASAWASRPAPLSRWPGSSSWPSRAWTITGSTGSRSAAPAVELVFLSPAERQAWRDSREALARGMAEMRRLATLQEDVRWGRATLSGSQQERLRQFLAARGEITAGDRFVLQTLRARARERQRYWLGVPMLLGGAAAALTLRGRRGRSGVSSLIRRGRAPHPARPPEAR